VGEAREKIIPGLGKEGDWKGVNGELDFVGGEAEGYPGRDSQGKGAIELSCKCVEVWRKGGNGGGSVGDQEGDGCSLIDLSGNGEGEGTVGISEDACGNLRACRSYQGGLVVFRGGRARSIEPSFRCGEGLGGRNIRHSVANGGDLSGSGRALPLITLHRGDSCGGLSVGLLGLGTGVVKMTPDKRGGIRVLAISDRVGFPRVREHVCLSAGVSVENAADTIIMGDIRVKASVIVADHRGGHGAWGQEVGSRGV